jgi:hypothetical protein
MSNATNEPEIMQRQSAHVLTRTSPLGEKFVGTCTLCGKTGLTIAQANDRCDNPGGVSRGKALLDAIAGTTTKN